MAQKLSQVAAPPLLFMISGIDQPYNTKKDRSRIAKHLSKRFHREKLKPLWDKPTQPQQKIVHCPIEYHHGGQRMDVSTEEPRRKKRKMSLKETISSTANSRSSLSAESTIPDEKKRSSSVSASTPPTSPSESSRDSRDASRQMIVSRKSSRSSSGFISPPASLGSKYDPFDSLPVLPDEDSTSLTIDYFLHDWAPHFDQQHNTSGYERPHLSIVFPLATENAVLLESLLAMCRVFWLKRQGIPWRHEQVYLKHRTRAVKLVQEDLKSEHAANNATLLAISCLTSIELLASNSGAVITHAHGLQLLLKKRQYGYVDSKASRYAVAQARAHVTIGRLLKKRTTRHKPSDPGQRAPATPPKSCLDKSYSNPRMSSEVWGGLPIGFRNLAQTGDLSLQCVNVISSLAAKTEEWNILRMTSDVDKESAFLYQWHEAPGKSPIEEFLVFGLISFCNQFPDKFEHHNPFFNIALKCFNDGVEAKGQLGHMVHQPWLIWTCISVSGVLEMCANPIQQRHIILDSLLEDCEDAREWKWVEMQLRAFLWTDNMGAYWKRCWDDAIRRRQGRRSWSTASSTTLPSTPSTSSTISGSQKSMDLLLPNTALGMILKNSCELGEAFRLAQM